MSNEPRRSSVIEWPETNLEEWLDRCPENDADTTLDESEIEAIASSRSRQIEAEIFKTYKYSIDRYTEVGLPHDMMNKKLQQFDDYLSECLTIMRKVVEEEYNKFVDYKENLMKQIAKMRSDLFLPSVDDNENYPLVQLCQRLRSKFNKLNVIKQERMTQLHKLRAQQIKHCDVLGIKSPEIKLQTDIPTQEELDALAKTVLDLAHEESKRKTKYSTLIETISRCMDQIDYVPKDEFEANALSATPNYTEDHMSRLSNFHTNLEKQFASNQARYEKLKARLESLYDRLDVNPEYRESFFESHASCKPKLMAEMEAEIEEYEELKRKNIGKFIEKIKTELELEYERCFISKQQQDMFLSLINSDDCNEQLLELCENELQRIKSYHEANKDILQKVSKLMEMFDEFIELEKKAVDPNRYKNRGGTLLQEEKQRKALERRLPKMEQELKSQRTQIKILDMDLPQFVDSCRARAKEVVRQQATKTPTKPANQQLKRARGPCWTPTPSKLQRTVAGTPSYITTRGMQPRNKSLSNGSEQDSSNVSMSEDTFDGMIASASSPRRILAKR